MNQPLAFADGEIHRQHGSFRVSAYGWSYQSDSVAQSAEKRDGLYCLANPIPSD